MASVACRKGVRVKRSALVLTVMVAGICLMLWAGWHNLRERRLALERARESHMAMMPQAPAAGQSAGNSADQDTSQPDLQGKRARLRPDSRAPWPGYSPAHGGTLKTSLAGSVPGYFST